MKAVFDTNILIDYLKQSEAAKTELARHRHRLISVVTWIEVLAGARNAEEEDVIEMFLRDFNMVEITRPIAREAIEIRRTTKIRLPDAIIRATAHEESALLVTRGRDFGSDDPGVRVPY